MGLAVWAGVTFAGVGSTPLHAMPQKGTNETLDFNYSVAVFDVDGS